MIDLDELEREAWFVISPEGVEQFCSCAADEEQSIREFFFADEEPYDLEAWDEAWWIEKQSEGFKCEPRLLKRRNSHLIKLARWAERAKVAIERNIEGDYEYFLTDVLKDYPQAEGEK